MIRLVLTDMDNTLVPFGRARVSNRTLAAMHACLDAGIQVGPVTGRNRPEAAGFLCGDEACYATGVFCNGQQTYLKGELIHEVTLDPLCLNRAGEIIRSRRGCALITYRSNGHADWVGDDPEALGVFVREAMKHGGERHDRLPEYPVVKAGIVACVSKPDADELRDEIVSACPNLDLLNTVAQWYDVVPRGWNKSEAIGVLSNAIGLSNREICVFGDAENDLSMFARVYHSCAVANATSAALAAARWHVGASQDDGVAIALEQIAEAVRTGTTPAFMRGDISGSD